MGKKILGLIAGFLLIGMIGTASATFLVEQYDGFWSTDVNALKNYADNNTASTSAFWDIIDFTDDPNGFAGALAGSNPWPSVNTVGATGTNHPLNTTFFAKITGDFFVNTKDTFTFRTYNDDGAFLYVDDKITIFDNTLHPERLFTGSQSLLAGKHSIELYFFENQGEASLEFSLAGSDGSFTHFNDPAYQAPVPEPTTMLLLGIGLLGMAGLARKKR